MLRFAKALAKASHSASSPRGSGGSVAAWGPVTPKAARSSGMRRFAGARRGLRVLWFLILQTFISRGNVPLQSQLLVRTNKNSLRSCSAGRVEAASGESRELKRLGCLPAALAAFVGVAV